MKKMTRTQSLVVILSFTAFLASAFASLSHAVPVYEREALTNLERKTDVDGTLYYEMVVDGIVVGGSLAPAREAIKELIKKGDTSTIIMHINSPGGEAAELIEFLNTATTYRGLIVTVNDGIAYSAGALLYAIGDIRVSGLQGDVLFHSVQMGYMGVINLEKLEALTSYVKAFNKTMYTLLESETGRPESLIRTTFFIENKEGHFLNYSKLKEFKMVDLEHRSFQQILATVGIKGIIKYDNHQDDGQNVGYMTIVERIQNAVSSLF